MEDFKNKYRCIYRILEKVCYLDDISDAVMEIIFRHYIRRTISYSEYVRVLLEHKIFTSCDQIFKMDGVSKKFIIENTSEPYRKENIKEMMNVLSLYEETYGINKFELDKHYKLLKLFLDSYKNKHIKYFMRRKSKL